MGLSKKNEIGKKTSALFERVVLILEQARGNVVRAVNSNMVLAYWLIGREIVEEIQSGEERAEYGKQIIENLSAQLTARYGRGFSAPTLWNFRQFYQVYAGRAEILSPTGRELGEDAKLSLPGRESAPVEKCPPAGDESDSGEKVHPSGGDLTPIEKQHPAAGELSVGFSPQLSWSHYRALMRVADPAARAFYEREAAECGWSKVQIERQIQSSYYQRIISNCGAAGLISAERERLPGKPIPPGQILKAPYVLEFLGLPDSPELHETAFEQAIIDNLQSFLLELGKGFSFVARQKHIRFDDDDFYVDLVFYNFMLKCFVLIDLKIGPGSKRGFLG